MEASEHCRAVLRARMEDRCLHQGEVHHDIRQYDPRATGDSWAAGCAGGFPCQAWSFTSKCFICPFVDGAGIILLTTQSPYHDLYCCFTCRECHAPALRGGEQIPERAFSSIHSLCSTAWTEGVGLGTVAFMVMKFTHWCKISRFAFCSFGGREWMKNIRTARLHPFRFCQAIPGARKCGFDLGFDASHEKNYVLHLKD